MTRKDCIAAFERFAKGVQRFAESSSGGPFGEFAPAGHLTVTFLVPGSFGVADEVFEAVRVLAGHKLAAIDRREMLRLVRELRPGWVIAENVPALKYRGYDRVAADLEEAGYACRPFVVGALHVGASQSRLRTWIVANANDAGLQGPERPREPAAPREERTPACSEPLRSACGYWPPGPGAVVHIPRMDDGPADRIHRLRALGNTIVPQVAEIIGRAVMSAYRATTSTGDANG